MLIAAAVVPHPPVLVPELAQGLAPDLDALRAACATALDRLYEAGAERLAVVGASQSPLVPTRGSFHRFGLDLEVDGGWPAPDEAPAMPLSLLIAAWLLRDRPQEPKRSAFGVSEEDGQALPLALGRNIATHEGRTAMLVMGDGSASRTPQAPGHFDERAEPYDAAVAQALATADHKALANLDPELSRELHAAGRPAWQVLAGAAETSAREYEAELLYNEAPYGVGYFVATWLAR